MSLIPMNRKRRRAAGPSSTDTGKFRTWLSLTEGARCPGYGPIEENPAVTAALSCDGLNCATLHVHHNLHPSAAPYAVAGTVRDTY